MPFEFFQHYLESNVVCLVIFSIMLAHDILKKDRREKQIKYDHTLVAFMAYFVSDTLWAAVYAEGVIPQNRLSVALVNFSNCVIIAAVTYAWLLYVMAVEEAPRRDRMINRIAIIFPLVAATVAMIVVYLVNPGVLLNDALELRPAYYVFQVSVPVIYIVAILFYSLRKIKSETTIGEKRKHIYVGFFPLMVIAGGLVQLLWLPGASLFCSSCTVFMLIFYIQSMEKQISIDPLTGLNNRGQLTRYISQGSSIHKDLNAYVLMIDINDFKRINDTYGHAEGDRALILVADALKRIADGSSMPSFLGRYGGDEFILIVHSLNDRDVEQMISAIRDQVESDCFLQQTPYVLFVGIGYDKVVGERDSFQKCIQRADHKLYLDKEYCKINSKTTVCK